MKNRIKRYVSYAATLAVVIVVSVWIAGKYGHFGPVEFTDNAQVRMQIVPVNSRVQGYIREIRFNEYEPVHKGDTLVIIDDSDYRLCLAQAEADLSQARAGRSVTGRGVNVASANVAVSEASIAEAKVLMEMAATDLERYRKMLEKEAVTRQQYDGMVTDYKAKKAR